MAFLAIGMFFYILGYAMGWEQGMSGAIGTPTKGKY